MMVVMDSQCSPPSVKDLATGSHPSSPSSSRQVLCSWQNRFSSLSCGSATAGGPSRMPSPPQAQLSFTGRQAVRQPAGDGEALEDAALPIGGAYPSKIAEVGPRGRGRAKGASTGGVHRSPGDRAGRGATYISSRDALLQPPPPLPEVIRQRASSPPPPELAPATPPQAVTSPNAMAVAKNAVPTVRM